MVGWLRGLLVTILFQLKKKTLPIKINEIYKYFNQKFLIKDEEVNCNKNILRLGSQSFESKNQQTILIFVTLTLMLI